MDFNRLSFCISVRRDTIPRQGRNDIQKHEIESILANCSIASAAVGYALRIPMKKASQDHVNRILVYKVVACSIVPGTLSQSGIHGDEPRLLKRSSSWHRYFDLVLLDIVLPDGRVIASAR